MSGCDHSDSQVKRVALTGLDTVSRHIDGVGHCSRCVCVSRVFVIFMSSLLSYLFWSMCGMFVCAWGWFGLPMDLFTPQFSVVCLSVSLGGPAPGIHGLREFCPGPSIFVDVLRIMPMSYLL